MPQPNDLGRSVDSVAQDATLVAVIEPSQSNSLIAGTGPGIERQPAKTIVPDESELLRMRHRWHDEATRSGRTSRALLCWSATAPDGPSKAGR